MKKRSSLKKSLERRSSKIREFTSKDLWSKNPTTFNLKTGKLSGLNKIRIAAVMAAKTLP